MLNFQRTVALPMVDDVADSVGYGMVSESSASMLDPEIVVLGIQPVCGSDDVIGEDEASMAASEVSHQTIRAVYSAFPELGNTGLERHLDAAYRIAHSHLRSEANFREAYPSTPGL